MRANTTLLLAALLISASVLAHAFFGRYEITRMQLVSDGSGFPVRLDKLTGDVVRCRAIPVPASDGKTDVKFECGLPATI